MSTQERIAMDTASTDLRLAITAENWEAVENIANQISYTAHRETLDRKADESGCALPRIEPITGALERLMGWREL